MKKKSNGKLVHVNIISVDRTSSCCRVEVYLQRLQQVELRRRIVEEVSVEMGALASRGSRIDELEFWFIVWRIDCVMRNCCTWKGEELLISELVGKLLQVCHVNRRIRAILKPRWDRHPKRDFCSIAERRSGILNLPDTLTSALNSNSVHQFDKEIHFSLNSLQLLLNFSANHIGAACSGVLFNHKTQLPPPRIFNIPIIGNWYRNHPEQRVAFPMLSTILARPSRWSVWALIVEPHSEGAFCY